MKKNAAFNTHTSSNQANDAAVVNALRNRTRKVNNNSSSIQDLSKRFFKKKKSSALRKASNNNTGNVRYLFQSVNPRARNMSLHRLISGWRLHGPGRGQERPGYNPRLKRFFALIAEKMHANRTGYMKLMKEGPLDVNVEYRRILKCLRHK